MLIQRQLCKATHAINGASLAVLSDTPSVNFPICLLPIVDTALTVWRSRTMTTPCVHL
jgi:hypothetical protein